MLLRNVALFLNASNALSIFSRGSANNVTILYAKRCKSADTLENDLFYNNIFWS
jgi:hypothetical protein